MNTAQRVISALSHYQLKDRGGGQYSCNSPFRQGSDSGAFSLKIEDGEHGVYHDFVSGESGSLYDLALKLGVLEITNVASTKRAYKDLEDYARAHGITAEHLSRAGWKQITHAGRVALAFPTKTGTRYRYLDGNKPYFTSINGYQRCWYGMNETVLARLAYGADLYIVNGEISVVVAQVYGLAAVCVTSGESEIPGNLLVELKEFLKPHSNTRVSIVLDCDEKGVKSSERIYKQLREVGINCRILDLGLSKGGDIADFLSLYGLERDSEALKAVWSLPERNVFEYEKKKRWKIMHADNLAQLTGTSWLVKGEIPDKGLTVLYGASGAGKSFVALDYALRISQEHTVVYVAGEGETGYHARIRAWCEYYHARVGNLYMCVGAVSILNNEDIEDFIVSVTEIAKRPRLIIIDTLARSMVGGDENSARDMGIFVDRCNMLQQRFDCGVMIVHHTNKSGNAERGSGALRGAADAMIRVSDDDGLIVVECTKSKDYEPFTTKFFKLTSIDVGLHDGDGNKIIPAVAVQCDRQDEMSGLTRNQRKILEAAEILDGEFTVNMLSDVIPEIDRGSIYRAIGRLKKLGYIEQAAPREPYTLTLKSREFINNSNVAVVAHVAVVHDIPKDESERPRATKNNRDNRDNRDKLLPLPEFAVIKTNYYSEGL